MSSVNNLKTTLIGSGGHARVLTEALRALDVSVDIVVSKNAFSSSSPEGVEFFDSDCSFLSSYAADQVILVNALGSLPGDRSSRKRLFELYRSRGYRFRTVVSPLAYVAPSVMLGEGTQVNAGAIVQAGAVIGANAIVNTGAIVEHDCVIGDHCHIAPGAVMSGGVELGSAVHVGAGARVIQGVSIGRGTVIGAGATVIEDIGAEKTYVSRLTLAVEVRNE